MSKTLSVHAPLLVNTLGHAAGTLIFGIFLYLLVRDRAGARLRGSRLTLAAALLAFLWNFASLLVIGWQEHGSLVSEGLVALSSSALSLLPAVLLHLSLGPRLRSIWMAGYALSALATLLHASEVAFNAPQNHVLALRVTTVGFILLTAAAAAGLLAGPGDRRLTSRLVGTMALFLFSLSFVHLGEPPASAWPYELLAHHAGIVLALFVLLQDHRFLLLDAFVRFLVNILLAAAFVFSIALAGDLRRLADWAAGHPFREGMLLVGGCGVLLLFAVVRAHLERLLIRTLFARRSLDTALDQLRQAAASAATEGEFLERAACHLADFLEADCLRAGQEILYRPAAEPIASPAPVTDLSPADRERLEALGVEAVFAVPLAPNDTRYILLGRRRGGRRYLSEDFQALLRLETALIEHLERLREAELRRLVSQAELRALESQIHPHFLFNALNTLYGIIPKQAVGARRTVLNLADILRYFLKSGRGFIPFEEELQIVRAYLEIESLRLGERLRTHIDVDPAALRVPIPVLSVEPLVENAVKHGLARSTDGGTVRLTAKLEGDALHVAVSDTGSGMDAPATSGAGVALDNVARRLRLSYGPEAVLHISTAPEGSCVEFRVPVSLREEVSPSKF